MNPSSCAKGNDAPTIVAANSCELHALGFRSERARTTTFHAFCELEFLAFLPMYNVNYGFEHVVNITLSRLEIQIRFSSPSTIEERHASDLGKIARSDIFMNPEYFYHGYDADVLG